MDTTEIFLSRCMSENELHQEIAEKLEFPAYYGKNFDALNDCLTEKASWNVDLYISDDDCENDKIEHIVSVFQDASEKSEMFSVSVITEEFLNIVDENGNVTNKSKPRSLVHRDGDAHLTVHIWIVKKTDMGIYVMVQKRSESKKVYPCCYDVSSAGHVSAGEEIKYSAVRELEEELGITVDSCKLEYLGTSESKVIFECDNGNIIDNEFATVYIYREPIKIESLDICTSEVSEVCWMDIDECIARINDEKFPNCIKISELKMIKKSIL